MRPDGFYAEALAAPVEWREWTAWPWSVLARIAIAAARHSAELVTATAHVTGDDARALLAHLAELERRVGAGDPLPFGDAVRPDFLAGSGPRIRNRRGRHFAFIGSAARYAIWAAIRATGPRFEARDVYDQDVPGAAHLAISHATGARWQWEVVANGSGLDLERARMWQTRAAAAERRADTHARRIPGAAARARAAAQPDPTAAMAANVARLRQFAAELAARDSAFTPRPLPDHDTTRAATVAAAARYLRATAA